jgi:hypothetical protein
LTNLKLLLQLHLDLKVHFKISQKITKELALLKSFRLKPTVQQDFHL